MCAENDLRPNFIKWLSELRLKDLPLVGGKGANLGELRALGFPVPNGFCITTEAFQYFAEKINMRTRVTSALTSWDIRDAQQLRKMGQALRKFVQSRNIPTEVKSEIIKAYHTLSDNKEEQAWVSVRSSATTEDQLEASFAGQFITYLNLRGDQTVVEAVLKCWASLFTERVIAYREKNDFSHVDVSMGVIVQEMVDVAISGVMFTIHPVTHDTNKVLIEATIGLGEVLVSGAVTPDTYLVDKQTLEVLEQRVGSKKRISLRNPIGGGVIVLKNPDGQEMKSSLTIEDVKKIAKYGRQIEAEYNYTPQDIEWATSGGNIYILQTRPVTGL